MIMFHYTRLHPYVFTASTIAVMLVVGVSGGIPQLGSIKSAPSAIAFLTSALTSSGVPRG
jgi:hypothetical protein